MSQHALDAFGEFIAKKVRDESLLDWKMIVDGAMKGERAARIRRQLAKLPTEAAVALTTVVTEIVDGVIYNTLNSIDNEESIVLTLRNCDSSDINIKSVSDGLAGELYGERGWIAKFSAFHD